MLTVNYKYVPDVLYNMAVGPRVLGHEPAVLADQREQAIETIQDTGPKIVDVRSTRSPALPILPDL